MHFQKLHDKSQEYVDLPLLPSEARGDRPARAGERARRLGARSVQ